MNWLFIKRKSNVWNLIFSGTGASCIYPLLAAKKFMWSMVGTDINKESIKNANANVEKNNLQHLIQGNYNIKLQL